MVQFLHIFSFTGVTYFTLAGLCDGLDEKVDDTFVLDMKTADNKKGLVFTGFTNTMMLLNQETSRWSIVSMEDESVIMELVEEVVFDNEI